jgi:hypothetical protein
MAGTSLFALLDDIATILDDVSLMAKVAAKKTAGVLGDDLALNAQQVSGIKSELFLVIIASVLDCVADRVKSFALGVGYIPKPLQNEEALARIRTLLNLNRAAEVLRRVGVVMKRTVIAALALIIFNCPSFAQDGGGFREMKWGNPLPENGFAFIGADPSFGGIKLYAKKGEVLEIGSGKASSIVYGFSNDRLFSVIISFEGYKNYHGIFKAAKEKYGEPRKDTRFTEKYFWPKLIETDLVIEYRETRGKGELFMVSKKLAEEWLKKKAKEEAK